MVKIFFFYADLSTAIMAAEWSVISRFQDLSRKTNIVKFSENYYIHTNYILNVCIVVIMWSNGDR